MAYTINKTDGTIFATVADGTVNQASSITIIGKNYAGYGEFLGENFVRMLENWANATAPTAPLQGQIWFDTANGLLKVYNGSTWKNLGSATSDSSAPTSPVIGDLWYDSANNQLKVYNGTGWTLVGPAFTAGTGTSGSIVEVVTDTLATDHVVVKLYVEDEVVGIISKDAEFTPQTAITGFSTVKPGIQLNSSVAGAKFQGTASDSESLGGQLASDFLSAVSNDTTTGTLTIQNDGGLTVGVDNDLIVGVTADNGYVRNATENGNVILQVNKGGIQTDALTVDGTSGLIEVDADPVAALGVATKQYVDSITSSGGDQLYRDGSNTVTGNILPDTTGTRNLGSAAVRYGTMYANTFNGTATTAQYADLAERFEADTAYEAGTVVELGGDAEVTIAQNELSDNVFGVVSTQAAYLMNAGAGTDNTHPPIAMNGRVPVKVIGKINKGDRLVSAGNGTARSASKDEVTAHNVIGRALEDKTTEAEGTVEAIVRINF
jgi:hypothetical protein